MKEPLLDFYERELAFIQEEAREFARRYPNRAEGLRLSGTEHVEDPHVSRLIHSFALLCARLRIKMQDEFPEICQSLLQALYPQYLAPIPPVSVCQLQLADASLDVPTGRIVARGERLDTDPVDGVSCQFRTCYETQLLPIAVTSIDYVDRPFPFPVPTDWKGNVEAALRIKLKSQSEKLALGDMKFEGLRFYLTGSAALSNELFEAICRDTTGVLIRSNTNTECSRVARQCVQPVGFANDEGILDHDARTIKSFRLLWEFFACPFKFRFVNLKIGSQWKQAVGAGNEAEILILLNKARPVIQREVKNDAMRLGCSPVVNLFSQSAWLRLTEYQSEYRIVANSSRPQAAEVVSVDSLHVSNPGGVQRRLCKPFYLPSHHAASTDEPIYYHCSRRRLLNAEIEGDRGTEVYLTLVNLKDEPESLKNWIAHIQMTCCNRDLASKIRVAENRHKIVLRSAGSAVSVDMLLSPTLTLRPLVPEAHYWRLLSHLALNHLSLTNSPDGADALREILNLYNPHGGDDLKRAIQAVEGVSYERVVRRLPTSMGTGFCRGIQIELVVDEERLAGLGRYLFALVLDNFFSQYATINSFTQLLVREKSAQVPYYQGPPRAGDRELI